ncbi:MULTISPECIES: N-acetylneuraminate synthase family protein [Thalassospira]|jgi:sialic acid synthase SpsE|uniref:N-acetylneuraminate synthase family protein n=1 Tax=Thalassospira TaxID=168934 RepID=UPI0007A57D8B|nr:MULTISPECIES: N-acetylneuraminate synthase family protein [unclassified Thalassospira]KZC99062.1 N-acylneuraminate-9-phosphate synthase [Thalassospira sp. MCCC 1A02898]ONH88642.1 N-acylneuraminate-9-phosphate synthase [Thalassospira sp. MCCC 1A02803]BDW90348.1 N-acetylneuraminate synthase [Thalassospira tepidiphila]
MNFEAAEFDFSKAGECKIIGEIGVNHNRDIDLLFKLIDAGIEAGVDIIKLQRFSSKDELSEFASSTDYQRKAGQGESQLQMAQKLELPDEWIVKAHAYCNERNIGFLCAAFDHGSVDFIADTLGCKSIKVPSPELNNKPLLQHMAEKFDALLISTGASYLSECCQALEWVEQVASREIAFMHCVSEYPAPLNELNLSAMATLRSALNVPVGYSDHSDGIVASIAAASLGAAMIEKHYTLDKSLPGPDHKASSDIAELKILVEAVKGAVKSVGDGIKRPMSCESSNRPLIRKTLTVNAPLLLKGTVLTKDMIGIKRPATTGAVVPSDIDKVVGLRLTKDKAYDEPIKWTDFQ